MSHILKLNEWESASGWHCADTSDLANGSAYWWHIPRMLNISLENYIYLLKDQYHVTKIEYDKPSNLLLWKWRSYSDCHKFVQFVNKEAKKRKFFI